MTFSTTMLCYYAVADCHYAEGRISFIIAVNVIMLSVIMLSVIMLSIIMLSIIILNVFILSVVMLSVVAPCGIIKIIKSCVLKFYKLDKKNLQLLINIIDRL
jgi:hypothetical protein